MCKALRACKLQQNQNCNKIILSDNLFYVTSCADSVNNILLTQLIPLINTSVICVNANRTEVEEKS